MFANTVIFSLSDIEKLEKKPELIDDYLKDVKIDLNKAYSAMKDEEFEDKKVEQGQFQFLKELPLQ